MRVKIEGNADQPHTMIVRDAQTGKEVTNVRGLHVMAIAGDIPRLTLEFMGAPDCELEGEAEIKRGGRTAFTDSSGCRWVRSDALAAEIRRSAAAAHPAGEAAANA
mgnify:CR=1 FL=1